MGICHQSKQGIVTMNDHYKRKLAEIAAKRPHKKFITNEQFLQMLDKQTLEPGTLLEFVYIKNEGGNMASTQRRGCSYVKRKDKDLVVIDTPEGIKHFKISMMVGIAIVQYG